MKTRLLFVCMLLAAVALAQERDGMRQFEALMREAETAYRNKQYQKSIEFYLKAAAVPEAAEWRGSTLYNVSCDYALLGNAEKAFEYLQRAIEAGYTNYRWMNKDSDFDFLRKSFAERFNATIAKAKRADKDTRLKQSLIAIAEFDNYIGPSGLSKHVWDDFNDPMMDSLRNKYHLYDIIENGRTEFDKMKILLHWVAHRWKHSGDHECKEWNALAILDAAEKGEQFRCVEYAVVLANCLTAVGFPARVVSLARMGVAYGTGKGHLCAEVWSNQFQKWILLDGQNDAWWELDGVPLSAQESRHLFVNDREGEMRFVGQKADVNYASLQSEWSVYFYHITAGFHHAFFKATFGENAWGAELLTDSVMPELFFQKLPRPPLFTDLTEEFYPRLNQTSIGLRHVNWKSASDTLEVLLTHTMPFFEKFLVRIDGSEWKESKDTFQWVLKKGENVIEAKAVNLAGIEGRTSRVALRNNIGAIDNR